MATIAVSPRDFRAGRAGSFAPDSPATVAAHAGLPLVIVGFRALGLAAVRERADLKQRLRGHPETVCVETLRAFLGRFSMAGRLLCHGRRLILRLAGRGSSRNRAAGGRPPAPVRAAGLIPHPHPRSPQNPVGQDCPAAPRARSNQHYAQPGPGQSGPLANSPRVASTPPEPASQDRPGCSGAYRGNRVCHEIRTESAVPGNAGIAPALLSHHRRRVAVRSTKYLTQRGERGRFALVTIAARDARLLPAVAQEDLRRKVVNAVAR